jgi:hypothetical protein
MEIFMNRIINYVCILAGFLILFGCSGSGSSSSQNTTPVQAPYSGSVAGSVTVANTALQFSETTSVSATFKKTDGTPASGIIINFSTTLGIITPASGIAVTDANGTATVQLTVGATSGQGQVTASATVDNKLVTKTGLFSVSLPPLKLSAISLGLSTLSYGGSTSVSVTVTNADGTAFTGQEVDVTFTSIQTATGKASINSPVKTVNGVARTTYQATTATGADTITASIVGSSVNADVVITPLSAGSISFVSASPTTIGLKGMGGLGILENSKVIFKVLDTNGQSRANQNVDFKLSTTVGGMSLSATQGSTATDGTVSVIISSGTVATPVRVQATINGTAVSSQSDLLVVSTGVPAQDGMSVSFDKLSTESLNYDNTSAVLTVSLADHFGNPAPDGTAVTFIAQVGMVDPSCTTVKGKCSANWTSSGQRIADGKNAFLVYAIGEESFVDLNGNGIADSNEFVDTTQAWRDDAHTGIYNASKDPFIDYNGSEKVDADGKFNGVEVPNPTLSNLKHIFRNPVTVMSTSRANIILLSAATVSSNPSTITFNVTDLNGRTMAAGTTIDLSASIGTLSSSQFIVPNTTADPSPISVVWSIDAATPPVLKTGSIKINVTSPVTSTITTLTIPINGSF